MTESKDAQLLGPRDVEKPELSVVIACYNANSTLGLQLDGLAAQLDAPSFEVLVVDNASHVAPDPVVDARRDRLNITICQAEEAQGVSYARNVGLARARAERVVFVDADDCVGPHFLKAAGDALEAAPFVTGNVISLDDEQFGGGVEGVYAALGHRGRQYVPGKLSDVDSAYPVFMGGASAVRRSEAVSLGGFDQAFVPGAEDNDFGIRALRAGNRVARCEGMVLAERRRKTSRAIFKRSFEGGLMHMKLCARHDLWATSPSLNNPTWWVDAARLPAAALLMLAQPKHRDLRGLLGRVGLRLGQTAGFLSYGVLKRDIPTQVGLGL